MEGRLLEADVLVIGGSNTKGMERKLNTAPPWQDELVSRISRKSIDVLKENFRDELAREDWQLVVKLKHKFQIG